MQTLSVKRAPQRHLDIRIRPATPETRNAFSSLLEEASAWQKARGSEAWSYPFDDDWMLPRIERGELFLVYLHTFAVRRSKAGLGIGEAVLEKVVGMGRERGLAKVRLDCFLSSANLIAYYERNGFVSIGTTSMKGKMMNLMERDI